MRISHDYEAHTLIWVSGQDSIGLLSQADMKKMRKDNFWASGAHTGLIPLSVTYSDMNRTFYGLSRKGKSSYLHIMKAEGESPAKIYDCVKIYKSGKTLANQTNFELNLSS